MTDQVIGVTIKGIGDFSDVVSNVGSVQKALTKLKLPDKLGTNLNKNIENFYKEYEKYQKKIAEGIHTQGDKNAVNKSLNSMLNSYEKIINEFDKLSKKDFKDIFNLDDSAFASVQKRIKEIQAEIKKIKIDPKQLSAPMDEIEKMTKAKAVSGGGKGLDKIRMGIDANDILLMKEGLQELITYYDRFASKMSEQKRIAMLEEINKLRDPIFDAVAAADKFEKELGEAEQGLVDLGTKASREMTDTADALDKTKQKAKGVVEELKQIHNDEFSFNRQAQDIDRQIQSYFGLSQMIRKVGDIAKDAFATVKELDKAMTQTAVVTNFSVGDMWDMLPTYTAQANQLGSTIKDVYEAATLYYQQGLNTNQAMGLANETLKMARIAGLNAADATNMMTAALRGFNMEINQMSAQKVNDIYSELAAITASDTKEIGSAMERTASIANSANMDFATTSAFLAQMIETTREAPENLGTAMKTIVARFQEMKQDPTKLIDSEGVAMDANKVDKALKTIGVNLMNTKGEFRDLDDVFLDIASKWDSLSQGQQRYIATIAAGSRQQSRFIAMMSDYERTMELVDAANNSAGASQRQFEKTLDSMEAKLNMLKNAWNQFTMGLMNNQILKFGVDRLTDAFTIVNKFIDLLGGHLPDPFGGIAKSVLTLVTTLGMLNFGKKASRGLITGGAGWWKGETSLAGGFAQGWKSSGQTGFFGRKGQARQAGIQDGQEYSQGFKTGLSKFQSNFKDPSLSFGKALVGDLKKIVGLTKTKAEIAKKIIPGASELSAEMQDQLNYALEQVSLGKIGKNKGDQAQYIAGQTGLDANDIENSNIWKYLQQGKKGPEELEKGFGKLGPTIANAGAALSQFGMILQGTPFEAFGNTLMVIGNSLSAFGGLLGNVRKALVETYAQTLQNIAANAGLEASQAGLAIKAKALGIAMWESLGPYAIILGVILALVGAYKLLDAAIETNKEQLEAATDAAAAASEAYDSAKQETSELADSIDTIRETDSAFDGLVAGTAEFNEQLVTANEQIMALIDKYPMLMDADKNYVSTDKNGLMHINEAGFKAVQEYQKQIQARASAMNLIQTADLNAIENQQKADDLRKVRGAMTQEEHEKNLRDADLLEQRIEAETKLARQNAIRTNLVDKEIADQEKLASIYVDQYEAKRQVAEAEVDAMGEHDIRQAYADYHGYTYDKSTKKIKDVEGNEIDYDDAAITDEVIEQTVMLDFEANASSLEGILHSLDRNFSKTLDGAFENSSTFISDVLSNNAETNEDLLQQVLDNPEQLNDFVEGLSTKELAAVLGASEEAVESNVDSYKQELEDKLLNNAQNIIDTTVQANGELAAMLAQAQGQSADDVLNSKSIQNNLIQQVKDFTSEQKNTLLNVGKILEESAGSEAMATFVNGLSNIYRTGSEELKTATQDWVDSVNWETAIGRLKGYNEAINMTTENTEHLGKESIKQLNSLGQSLLNSQDEANLLSEAFEEFYNSTDFQEMAENMDKFVDSSGQLNAASVMDMAEECHSLNSLLDTGAISAGGVAAALNALGSNGDLVLSDLNSRVLELLSNFGQLDDIIASSHRNIENFDWGIDTGEAEDFVKESAEKWNELYKNGEVGNPQLEAYAKWVMGEDKYIALLADKNGDLQKTMAKVSKSVNLYSDGFEEAWDKLAEGSWENVEFTDDLKDLGISVSFDNGDWVFEPGQATTEQLQEWLQQALQIGPEMARAMIEDWSNYSPDFRAERQKNDFEAGLDSYVEQRRGANGEVAITASELNTIIGATGQEKEDIRAAIAERAGIDANQVKILENINENTGEYVTDGAILNKELTQAVGAKGQNGWLAEYQAKDSNNNFMKNTIDVGNAMAAAVERGYTEAQAKSMAYESYTNAEQQGKDYYYKGELLEAGQYKTLDQFAARLEEIDQNEQWVTVGQAMADGFLSRVNEYNNPDESSNKDNDSQESSDSTKNGKVPPSVQKAEDHDQKTSTETDKRNWLQKLNDWYVQGQKNQTENVNGANTGEVQKQSDFWNNFWSNITAAAEKQQEVANAYKEVQGNSAEELQQSNKDFWSKTETSSSESTDNLNTSGNILSEAAAQLLNGTESLSTAGEALNTAASNLTTAAAVIVAGSSPSKPNQSGTVPGVPQTAQPNQSSVSGAIVIDNSTALESLDEVYNKATETAAKINEGASFTITTPGLTNLTKAASEAQKVTDNAGSKDISLNTSIGGASSDSIDTLKESVKKFNALGNHAVTLTTNLKGASASSIETIIAAINAFHLKTDHTVTLKTIKETVDKQATGAHNHGYASPPSFGSAARGSYGQVGPKGKGGLTLTGELGYEIAWIPSENRSMILGANGPQLVNLPGDAVVWTHEQSEKILKQKAIPAGSHSRRPRQNTGGTGGGGGGTSYSTQIVDEAKKTGKDIAKKAEDTKKAIARVSVWWENAARRADVIQRKMDKNQDTYEKYLKNINSTLDGAGSKTGGKGNKFIANTRKYIAEQQRQEEKATKELKQIKTGKWQSGKREGKKAKATRKNYERGAENVVEVSYKNKKGKEKTDYINLKNYVKKKNGTYLVDQKALNKEKNVEKRKAIAEAANKEIDSRITKKNNAADEIKKAQEALERFSQDLYDTFFGWEIELTRIQNLTQQIDALTSKIARKDSMEQMINAQIQANGSTVVGANGKTRTLNTITAEEGSKQLIKNFNNRLQLQQDTLSKRRDTITQSRKDLSNKLYGNDIATAINDIQKQRNATTSETKKLGFDKALENLYAQRDAVNRAQQYFKKPPKINDDGTIDIDFNTEKFEQDQRAGKITDEMGKAIQDYVKELEEGSQNLGDLYSSQIEGMTELYNQVNELNDQWADYENQLLEINEGANRKELEQVKKINDSIKKALDELLSEVKKKLDERRKQEDNLKTERDISQKQQRLAMLRADTAGGHQVEIAQLEKEIADAQQNYQRSLEDQLIEKLQNQADEAAKQRERQIELQEGLLNSTNNIEEVQKWMASPEDWKEEVLKQYRKNNNYDNVSAAEKDRINRNFTTFWAGLLSNEKEREAVFAAIDKQEGEAEGLKKTEGVVSSKGGGKSGEPAKVPVTKTSTPTDNKDKKEDKKNNKTNIMQTIMSAIVNNRNNPHPQPEMAILERYASQKGITWGDVLTAYKVIKGKKAAAKAIEAYFGKSPGTAKKKGWKQAFGKDYPKYASGGLASHTGPAWLDGTPSKPELVLNAADTKNFIALKDVLSKAMSSTGAVENNYGGDTLYEININVDKIEKDYDVDRVVDKVKKEIVKGAGYGMLRKSEI